MVKLRVSPTKVKTVPTWIPCCRCCSSYQQHIQEWARESGSERDPFERFHSSSQLHQKYARRFQVFVAYCIQRIKSSKNFEQWAYVAFQYNHVSQGITAGQLQTSNWFTGLKFLWQTEMPDGEWKVTKMEENDREQYKAIVCDTKKTGPYWITKRNSVNGQE